MTSRDNQLWIQSWRDKNIDFHQPTVNQLLTKFWPRLKLPLHSRVFVPLCGKSQDMLWLVEQGYEVIGVELSPIAVRELFRENSLVPVKRRTNKFTVWECGKLKIFCGDVFSLSKKDLGVIDMVYDRAALTALPVDLRKQYVMKLDTVVSKSSGIFLLTTEEASGKDRLSHTLGVDEEINTLYKDKFNIDLLHAECVHEFDAASKSVPQQSEYKVYRLHSKGALAAN